MCAITDHDTFNYELYEKLKKEEKTNGSIKKVLPGVEFSVKYQQNKVIHIVTIFNDDNTDKVKAINNIFASGIGKKLYKNGSYSKEDYYKILREIDLDFVMIAHQKKTPTSLQKPKKADVMSLGQDVFDELLFMEYFDAYEFHDKANEIYNKQYAIEKNAKDKLRFITGTDCHDWFSYPHYDSSKKGEVCFTFLKALPTFKGLAMAITDIHRINYTDSFFGQGKYEEEIIFDINGQEVRVPLSRGINVIIGDNSIGKSLILHALTENRELKDKSALRRGYERYMDKYHISVKSHFSEKEVFKFNYQGQIREIFDDPNMKADKYLGLYFPEPINSAKYRNIVEKELEKLYSCIEKKFHYDDCINNLHAFELMIDEPQDKELTIGGSIENVSTAELRKLLTNFDEIIQKLENEVLVNMELLESDKNYIRKEIDFLKIVQERYQNMYNKRQCEKSKINIYNTCIKKYKEDYMERQTDVYNKYTAFIENKQHAIEDIVTLVEQRQKIKPFHFQLSEVLVVPEQNPVDTYVFVSKIGIEKINIEYLQELLCSVLKNGKKIDIENLNRKKLKESISRYPNDIEDVLEGLKFKINLRLDEDFKIKKAITENEKDVFEELSDGFNSRIYFKLLTGEEKNKGIYIIDQPEDHISQKAIKEDVLDQFRRMSHKRQIIMVTHNPQFIVNLDVDNVIFLSKQNEQFVIQSGALEYEEDSYNILKIVADNIDGGLNTIKERMKRYDKDIQV